ncbi:UDP-N-acetylglucosamine:N-acetylmuramyl-(pentapeptide) pyrophosphoryl-undecaprenol N-acetylglucosamine transferase [Salmonella enterica subsp. arizonae]|nr:UDP-N-acetylglucosamine:N-acetylmuramyl-(pentapeptide) pyrophosphoryl-undecaprenol N-acetylglucosamine transferase [Salmonella enterica subsp. arizonae]
MKRFKPDVVLGMGGYVSGPGGLAAWSLGIPVVLHEQNGIAGLTNKWLAKIATTGDAGFPRRFPERGSGG